MKTLTSITNKKTPFDYVLYSLLGFMGVMIVIALFAFIYNKKSESKTDDATYSSLIMFGLQIFDFVSDINLSIEISKMLIIGNTENKQILLFIIAIGSIIKGGTPNFDFISSSITNGLMQISILHKKPIGNAILTCLNPAQAKARANKGYEAAIAVSKVLNVK